MLTSCSTQCIQSVQNLTHHFVFLFTYSRPKNKEKKQNKWKEESGKQIRNHVGINRLRVYTYCVPRQTCLIFFPKTSMGSNHMPHKMDSLSCEPFFMRAKLNNLLWFRRMEHTCSSAVYHSLGQSLNLN